MKTVEEKFWESVNKTDGCWEWQGYLRPDGYGDKWYQGRLQRAHRVAYQIAKGTIPDGLLVCHQCDNRKCVNPAHLFLGTHKVNAEDMAQKGRSHKPNTSRTHCKYGHPFTLENTLVKASGGLECRECNNLKGKKHYHKNKHLKPWRKYLKSTRQAEHS